MAAASRRAAGRAVHPHPVLRLALSVLRLRGLRRGRRRAVRRRGSRRSSPRCASSWTCAPTRSTRRSRPAGRRSRRSISGAGRRRCCRRRRSPACWSASGRGSASPTARRSRSRPTRVRTSAATRRPCARPASRGCRSVPRRCRTSVCGGSAGGTRPSESGRPSPRRARPGSGRSASTCCTTSPDQIARRLDRDARAALALEPDHLSLYALTLDDPDAEGLTGPDGDHLPTTAGARRWREAARPAQDEDRAAAQYHHAVHRLAEDGWRGYEISNWARPGPREPAQPRLLGAAAVRGGRARARTPSTGSTRRWNAARLDGYLAALTPTGGARRRCRPAAPRRSTRPLPPPRR